MWKYIRRYLPCAVLAALFMIGEVMMDLIQPGIMSQIVDDGVLGLTQGGAGDMNLVWRLGFQMILLVLFGGFCGSMNNVFVHMSGQNIGNEIRKDCFRRIMTFSFPQMDSFVTGSLVTRVTNDITQVQNFVSQFVRNDPHNASDLWKLFQNISRGYASWKRVKQVLESEPEIKDGSFEGSRNEGGTVEFRDVSFSFPGSGQPALEHIDLKVYRGETVGVMGATGCGKSALIHLIPRFYDVSSGEVLVDGVDVREYRHKALREKIAITLQKSELFSDTIRKNISWGKPGAEDSDIKKAAAVAQADDFISATTESYDTPVAERGMSLSGGQKQRISIARAVLKPAEIFIFDDSTSALDLKTEANLYEALQKSHPQSTKIIVAQRIASVRRADRIVVMDHGRIAAVGTHEELMESCRIYQDICRSQSGEEVAYAG